jgi:hypothetical protein
MPFIKNHSKMRINIFDCVQLDIMQRIVYIYRENGEIEF